MRAHASLILAVCGLRKEAQIASGQGVATLACGGHAAALRQHLPRELARLRPLGLVSFGIAGGLDPTLDTGTILIGSQVICGTDIHASDMAWSKTLATLLPQAQLGPLAAVDQPLAHASDKLALFARTGARAVDMESQHVAHFAKRHDLPFAVLRAIADPAQRTLPPAALYGLKSDGSPDILAVLQHLLRAPTQLPALLKVAGDSHRALKALLSSRARLGPGLAFPDFS